MAQGDLKGTLQIDQNSITNPTSATGSVAVSVGDLVRVVANEQANNTWGTCTDNLGHTYTPRNAGNDAGVMAAREYYLRVTTAGTLTTISVAATASTDNAVVVADVFEGPFLVSPLDADPANTTNDVSDPLTCPATGTRSTANQLVLCFYASNGNPTVNADSPNLKSIEHNSGTTLNTSLGYQTVSNTTTITPTFDLSGSPTASVLGTSSYKFDMSKTITADAGSYALTGGAASLEYGREVVAGGGSYALGGSDVTLTIESPGITLVADPGAYDLTGGAASLEFGYEVVAGGSSYALGGVNASLEFGYEVVAGGGSYALGGVDVTFERTYILGAGAESYALTGAAALLEYGREIVAGPGAYALSGAPVTFERSYILEAGGETYALSGTDASMRLGKTIVAGGESYALTGAAALLERGYEVAAGAGSYALNGKQLILLAPGDPPFGAGSAFKVYLGGEWVVLPIGVYVANP